jgi:hypothetical protein
MRSVPARRESTPTVTKPRMNADQSRRARNEALFREVNERIEELEAGLTGYGEDDSLLVGFVCECSREDCGETIEVTRAHYNAVRNESTRFLVLPGHETPDLERVVDRHPHFLVVEKLGDAGDIAAAEDPRS